MPVRSVTPETSTMSPGRGRRRRSETASASVEPATTWRPVPSTFRCSGGGWSAIAGASQPVPASTTTTAAVGGPIRAMRPIRAIPAWCLTRVEAVRVPDQTAPAARSARKRPVTASVSRSGLESTVCTPRRRIPARAASRSSITCVATPRS